MKAMKSPLVTGVGSIRNAPTSTARRGRGVIDPTKPFAQRCGPERVLREPEVLERRDVPEVPDDRAQQGVVDAIERVLRKRFDQGERPGADRLEPGRGDGPRGGEA